jgi:hypothetical protein
MVFNALSEAERAEFIQRISEEVDGIIRWRFHPDDQIRRGIKPYAMTHPAAVKRIMILQATGYSFERIAGILGDEGVPTTRAWVKWHGWTVRRIAGCLKELSDGLGLTLAAIESRLDMDKVSLKDLRARWWLEAGRKIWEAEDLARDLERRD